MKQAGDLEPSIIVYGRTVPLTDGRSMWVGIHPFLFNKKKCTKTVQKLFLRNNEKESEVMKRFMKKTLEESDRKFEENTFHDHDAMSVVFHRIAVAMEEAPVFSELPKVNLCDECRMLTILPGHLTTPPGSKGLEKLVTQSGTDEEGKPKYVQVPWIFKIGKDVKPEEETESDGGDFRKKFNSKFIFRCDPIPKDKVTSIRTSSWLVKRGDDTQASRALVEGAFIFTALANSAGFSVRKHGTEPLVTFDEIEKDGDLVFSVSWVLKKKRKRRRRRNFHSIHERLFLHCCRATSAHNRSIKETRQTRVERDCRKAWNGYCQFKVTFSLFFTLLNKQQK